MTAANSYVYTDDEVERILGNTSGDSSFLNKPTVELLKRKLINEKKQLISRDERVVFDRAGIRSNTTLFGILDFNRV